VTRCCLLLLLTTRSETKLAKRMAPRSPIDTSVREPVQPKQQGTSVHDKS